jgi:hypothetical protein
MNKKTPRKPRKKTIFKKRDSHCLRLRQEQWLSSFFHGKHGTLGHVAVKEATSGKYVEKYVDTLSLSSQTVGVPDLTRISLVL